MKNIKFKNILILSTLLASIAALSACNSGNNTIIGKQSSQNNTLKIVDGESLSILSKNSDMYKFSLATVGIFNFKYTDETKTEKEVISFCTGVAISANQIITAAHCVTNTESHTINNNKYTTYGKKSITDNQDIILFFPDESDLSQSGHHIKITVKNITTYGQEKDIMTDGQDIAIITFNPSQNFQGFKNIIPESSIIYKHNNDNIMDMLTKTLWQVDEKNWGVNNEIFYLGWGSNKKFELSHEPSYEVKYPEGLFGEFYRSFNITTGDPVLIHNENNKTENGYKISKLFDGSHTFTDKSDEADFPNILKNTTAMRTQGGDSGGPVFVCKENLNKSDDFNTNKCFLVAVTTGGTTSTTKNNKTDFVADYFTTLSTIFFKKIAEEAGFIK